MNTQDVEYFLKLIGTGKCDFESELELADFLGITKEYLKARNINEDDDSDAGTDIIRKKLKGINKEFIKEHVQELDFSLKTSKY